MKLEMRAWDLDIRLEIEDENSYNQLEVIQAVKDLLDTLTTYSSVNLSIVSVPQEEEDDDRNLVEEDSRNSVI